MNWIRVVVVVALTLVCMGVAILLINALFNALSRRAHGHGDPVPADGRLVTAAEAEQLRQLVSGGAE